VIGTRKKFSGLFFVFDKTVPGKLFTGLGSESLIACGKTVPGNSIAGLCGGILLLAAKLFPVISLLGSSAGVHFSGA